MAQRGSSFSAVARNAETCTRTIETLRYCGPSGNRTETRVVSTDIDTHKCWDVSYFGCDFRGSGSLPGSVCR